MSETADLPASLRGLIDDAVSEAKRFGHDRVTPLHVAVAIQRVHGPVALAAFSADDATAIHAALAKLPRTFGAPEIEAATSDLVRSCAGSSDALAAIAKSIKDQLPALMTARTVSATPQPEVPGLAPEAAPAQDGSGAMAQARAGAGGAPSTFLPEALGRCVDVVSQEAPTIPRVDVAARIAALLSARDSQPPLLVARRGEGRSTLAQCLAAFLATAEGRTRFAHRPVVRTRAESIVTGERGQAIEELRRACRGRAILFIDDLEVLASLGWSHTFDPGMPLAIRGALGDPDLPVVLALESTYVDRFQSQDRELFDRLQRVDVPPIEPDDIREIALAGAVTLSEFHQVKIPETVISAALAPPRQVDLLAHPGLAIARLDRAAASARAIHGSTEATAADLGTATSGQQYVGFDAEGAARRLSERIFGQDDAIASVTSLLAVSRAALDANPQRPDGVFVFAGPTGTGKTALALALARELFGSEDAVVRLDMSEYNDEWAISKLIGPPPGYIGSQEPESWMTTRIRNRPQSVLLLDEVEKADPRVWNTFLQVFDAGRLTDSAGRVADFRDVVIVLTTNIGSETFSQELLGFSEESDRHAREADSVVRALRDAMRPELINRLDHVLVFRPLGRETVRQIASARIAEAVERYRDRGWDIAYGDDLVDFIVSRGYSRQYGARPMLRAIDQMLGNPVARVPVGRYSVRVAGDRIELVGR